MGKLLSKTGTAIILQYNINCHKAQTFVLDIYIVLLTYGKTYSILILDVVTMCKEELTCRIV